MAYYIIIYCFDRTDVIIRYTVDFSLIHNISVWTGSRRHTSNASTVVSLFEDDIRFPVLRVSILDFLGQHWKAEKPKVATHFDYITFIVIGILRFLLYNILICSICGWNMRAYNVYTCILPQCIYFWFMTTIN